MQPMFTIHAGEYLVGSHIEKNHKGVNVWLPSKDTGIDLLLSNSNNSKTVSIQVKFSKDFLATHMDDIFQKGLKSCGWWTLNHSKIKDSKADFWIFVQHSFNDKNIQYTIIKPDDLLNRLVAIHGKQVKYQMYLWVTNKSKCWEARGLKKKDQILTANDSYKDDIRDFSKNLNNWDFILKLLK